jgi:hypothetical protein
MRLVLFAFAVSVVALASPTAQGSDRDPVVADALLREGRAAAASGDYRSACPKIAESLGLDPNPTALFDLADCEERLGRLAAALTDYRKAVDALPPSDPRAATAKEKAAMLDKRVPRLTIRLGPGAPAGTPVKRDGVEMGPSALGIAIPADPGKHVVVAGDGGHERRYEVDLAEGQAREVVVERAFAPSKESNLPDRGPASSSISPEAQAQRSFSGDQGSPSDARIFGYVVGGIGVASLAVGVVTRVLALGKKSAIDAHCDADKVCDTTGLETVSAAQDLQTASTVTLGLGISAVTTGALLILLNPARPARSTVTPTVLPGGAGLTVSRSF